MPEEAHFRLLERLYLAAPTNRYYDPSIRVSEGAAEVRIPLREDFHHAAAAVHGSVYFKAMDDAAFFACNSVVEDVLVLTRTFTIHFLRPVSDGVMVATGRLVNRSSRVLLAEAVLTDGEGREIGRGTGTFMPSRIRLEELEERRK